MNKYTTGQLKKLLENIPDDAIVNIERVEDIYFDKYGWTTQRVVFQELNDLPYEYNDYFPAHCGIYLKDKNEMVILAHY